MNDTSNNKIYITVIFVLIFIIGVLSFMLLRSNRDISTSENLTEQNTGNLADGSAPEPTIVQGGLVSSFPEFIQYPGSTIITSSSQEVDDDFVYRVVFEVPVTNHSEVVDWYEEQMLQSEEYEQVVADESGLFAVKGERSYTFRVNSVENGTQINLLISDYAAD